MIERWPADPTHVGQAAERLRDGGVIAFPTDTLYAVGARAGDLDPVIDRLIAWDQGNRLSEPPPNGSRA